MSEDLINKAKEAYEKSLLEAAKYWKVVEQERLNSAFSYFKNIFPEIIPLPEKNRFELLGIEFNYLIYGTLLNIKNGTRSDAYVLRSIGYSWHNISDLASLGKFLLSDDYLKIKNEQNNPPPQKPIFPPNTFHEETSSLFGMIKKLFKRGD